MDEIKNMKNDEKVKMAENQPTSIMSSRKIAAIMNNKFKERGEKKKIGKRTSV